MGEVVGKQFGIDEVYVELLLQDKVVWVEVLEVKFLLNEKFIFVGDGINDMLVFVCVDIGVVMGGFGLDVVVEVVDVVLMIDQLLKIMEVIWIVKWIC